jgi:hypothetical protein
MTVPYTVGTEYGTYMEQIGSETETEKFLLICNSNNLW